VADPEVRVAPTVSFTEPPGASVTEEGDRVTAKLKLFELTVTDVVDEDAVADGVPVELSVTVAQ
jgi:hypothetical protein